MAQIINDPGRSAGLGQALGGSITQALQGLAERRIQDLSRQKSTAGLQSLLGLTPQEAEYASYLEPSILKEFAKHKFQEPANQAYAQSIADLVGGRISQPQGMQQPQQQQGEQMAQPGQPEMQRVLQEREGGPIIPNTLNQHQAEKLAELHLKKQNSDLARQKIAQSENKEVREFIKPFYQSAAAARRNIRDYDALIDLAKKGDIRSGPAHQVMSALGFGDFFQNYDTQLANKFNARLAQNIRSAFGEGRITNFLEQTYQRSLPSLWNTPEGIIGISEINKRADEVEILKEGAAYNAIALNEGRIPFDVYRQIEQQIEGKVKDLEDETYRIAFNMSEMASAKKNNTKKVSDRQKAEKDPLSYPQFFKDGSVYQGHVLRNGKWEKS